MSEESKIAEVVARVAKVLDDAGISHHFTGGLVSSYYGDPRFTQNIDIVTSIEPSDAEELISKLENHFEIDPISVAEAISERRLFQALDNENWIKVDFHVGEGVPGEFSRSKTVSLFSGVNVKVTSVEDALISKLRWIKLGSFKSKDDAIGILASNKTMDFELVNQLCSELQLGEQLKDVLIESR